jgi:plasmid stability protein
MATRHVWRRGSGSRTGGRPNDLLIVGYDREPDTMNRYATHISKTSSRASSRARHERREDEHRAVLAAEIPTLENGGVSSAPTADGRHVEAPPGVKWHDGSRTRRPT